MIRVSLKNFLLILGLLLMCAAWSLHATPTPINDFDQWAPRTVPTNYGTPLPTGSPMISPTPDPSPSAHWESKPTLFLDLEPYIRGTGLAGNVTVGREPHNHVPVAVSQSVSTDVDQPLVITLSHSDADADPISTPNFFISPLHGVLTPLGGNNYNYEPAPGFEGVDTFAYRVDDGRQGLAVAAITITVGSPTELAPVITVTPASVTTAFETPTIISISAEDPNTMTPLAPAIIAAPGDHGTVSGTLPNVTYTPDLDFFGHDTIVIRAVLGQTSTILVQQVIVQDPPISTGFWAGGIYQGDTGGYGDFDAVFDSTLFPDGPLLLVFDAQDEGGGNVSAAGYLTVDNTAPEICDYVTPPTPADGSFRKEQINLKVHAEDQWSGVQLVRLMEPSVRDYLSIMGEPNNYAILNYNTLAHPDAPTDFVTRCVDNAGNFREISREIIIDNTPPNGTTTITPAPVGPNGLVRGVRTITINGNDGAGSGMKTVRLYLKGAGAPQLLASNNSASLTFNLNTLAYADGDWDVQAEVEDNLGQKRTIVTDIRIDNTPPAVAIQSPGAGAIVNASLTTITATITDANGITARTILIDGANTSFTQSGNVYTIAPFVTNGIHTLTVQAIDTIGNTGEVSHSFVLVGGSGGGGGSLAVEFLKPVNGDISIGTLLARVVTTEGAHPITGVTLRVNGGSPSPMTDVGNGIYELTVGAGPALTEGSAILEATVQDAASMTASDMVTITVDNTDPAINTFLPNGVLPLSGVQNLYMAASDNVSLDRIELFVPNQSEAAASRSFPAISLSGDLGYTLDTTQLPDGPATLRAVAIDKAGHVAELSRFVVIANGGGADAPPTIQVLSPANNQVVGQIVNLKMRVIGDNILSAGFNIDGGAMMPATETSPGIYELLWDTTLVADGFHTIGYFAANSGGSAPPTSILVRVDNTPPSLGITNPTPSQVLFLVQNLIGTASDGAFKLQSVTFRINADDKAFFPGNTNLTDLHYSYLFDTEELDGNGDRRYPDGNSYIFTMIATDLAGNQAQVSVPFAIDHSNIPISDGTVTWTPTPAVPITFVVGPENTFVSAAITGATVDPALLTGASLKVYAEKDGVRKQLAGTVVLNGNTVEFRGTIPYNARISCVLSVIDTAAKLIRGTHEFVSGMDKDLGGAVTRLPEELFNVTIPPAALTEDALVEIVPVAADQAPAPELGTNQETVYGPVKVTAMKSDGTYMEDVNSSGRLVFSRPANQIPAQQLSGYFDSAWKWDGSWVQLGDNGGVGGSAADGGRTVRAPFTEFGFYRITTAPLPGSGITDLFNYPNPFSPAEGGTRFSFLLGDATGIEVTIYDLLGNLVLRRSHAGSVGPNTIQWDGRNGAGDEVANGGYIAVFRTNEGSRATRKVGVAK